MKILLPLLACLTAVAAHAAGEKSTPSSWAIEATFPRTPTVESTTMPTPLGTLKETHAAVEDGELLYIIIRVELGHTVTDEHAAMFNEIMLQSMLAARKAVLTQHEKTAIASHEALRYEVEIPEENKRGDWRMFLIGQDFYTVAYEAPPASYATAQARAFFHSIRERIRESTEAEAAVSKNLPASWAIDAVFPQPPDIRASEKVTADGRVQETQATFEQKEVIFSVFRDVFPKPQTADQANELVTSARQSVLRNGKGEIKREEKTTIADLPGQRYVVDYTHEFNVADYRIDYRMVTIDGVAYTFAYRAPLSIFSADQARSFFKSVKKKTK